MKDALHSCKLQVSFVVKLEQTCLVLIITLAVPFHAISCSGPHFDLFPDPCNKSDSSVAWSIWAIWNKVIHQVLCYRCALSEQKHLIVKCQMYIQWLWGFWCDTKLFIRSIHAVWFKITHLMIANASTISTLKWVHTHTECFSHALKQYDGSNKDTILFVLPMYFCTLQIWLQFLHPLLNAVPVAITHMDV